MVKRAIYYLVNLVITDKLDILFLPFLGQQHTIRKKK